MNSTDLHGLIPDLQVALVSIDQQKIQAKSAAKVQKGH